VLSLARNALTRIEGLDPVCGTLQELWLSYNQVIKLSGLEACTRLRVLYLANNLIREFKELEAVPGCVEDISLVGNPVWEAAKLDGGVPSAIGSTYRIEILRRLPHLKKIDGVTVDPDERDAAAKRGLGQTVAMGATMGHTTRSAGSADGGQERGGEVVAAAPAAPDVAAT
jgi:dynein light chain 1